MTGTNWRGSSVRRRARSKTSEGVRRLSVVVGGVFAVEWSLDVLVLAVIYPDLLLAYGVGIAVAFWLIGVPVSYFGGVLVVRVIARITIWVVEGFRETPPLTSHDGQDK